jgi:outer membrane protein
MRKQIWLLPVLGMVSTAIAHAQCKVGIIHIQNAIVSTKEGQKAAADLDARVVSPKRKALEADQSEIQTLQGQLQKGSAVLSEDQKAKLMRDIDQKTKSFNRKAEDANTEIEQEQGKVLQELGGRMMQVIDKYAKEKGYCLILDVSSQQTPVLYAANEVDVTKEIIDLYDKAAPAPGSAAPAAPPKQLPTSTTPAVTPVPAPAQKKK